MFVVEKLKIKMDMKNIVEQHLDLDGNIIVMLKVQRLLKWMVKHTIVQSKVHSSEWKQETSLNKE